MRTEFICQSPVCSTRTITGGSAEDVNFLGSVSLEEILVDGDSVIQGSGERELRRPFF
jgi:hypothetical protein